MSVGRWVMPWMCGCKNEHSETVPQCARCGYHRPPPAHPVPHEVCWLIESNKYSQTEWAIPHSSQMHTDAGRAWRFATKEHAERVIELTPLLQYAGAHATDHVFIGDTVSRAPLPVEDAR